jgi:hypothetical protein
LEFLQEYDFEFEYLPGKDNVVADALSRRSFVATISVIESPLGALVRSSLDGDEFFGGVFRDLSGELTDEMVEKHKNYRLVEGILYYKGRMCIPKVKEIQESILRDCHEIPIAGHPGFEKTYRTVRKSFFWPGIKTMVRDYVLGCSACQRTKAERVRRPGLLQPIDIPEMKWECVSLDFVTALPRVRGGFDSILVVVDRLTKVAHFIPVKSTATAVDIARVFVREIFRLHGMPKVLVSDRDVKFTSHFWGAFFDAVGTTLKMSTAYHPETDGQTERVNQVMEDMLRMYCLEEPSKWYEYLPLVEFAYNNTHHSSLGMTPFSALYGQEVVSPVTWCDPVGRVEISKEMLDNMEDQSKKIKINLRKAQSRQKSYADRARSSRSFEVGDRVWLRVRPRKSTLSTGKYSKLSPRYCGPFRVLKRIGEVAYKLELPDHVRVHDVFHVSLLKPYVPDTFLRLDDSISIDESGSFAVTPEYLIEARTKQLRGRAVREYLVKWTIYPIEEASWVSEEELRKDFPNEVRFFFHYYDLFFFFE